MINLRTICFIIIAVAIGFIWLHYQALESDLKSTKVELATARANLNVALDAAKSNLESLNQAESEHRTTLALLNDVHSNLSMAASIHRELELGITGSDASLDGDVAPVLENLRKAKFGGVR